MSARNGKPAAQTVQKFRCAIYTRKSTEDGLEQEFNSLDAQREAGESYIRSQIHEGWECLPDRYDDGGFTGGNMERPALQRLLEDIEAGRVDCVVVYKVDRLSRSLLDFARILESFEKHHVSFVSVTQQFNTATSMGRLILNVLLSFAQFEREMISERTRDKIAATHRKGKWAGGKPLLGYNVVDTKLVVVPEEAEQVRQIFRLYSDGDGLTWVAQQLEQRGWCNKRWTTRKGDECGGRPFNKSSLYKLVTNVTYTGKVRYKDEVHPGEHQAIIPDELWQRVQAKLDHNGRTGGAMVRNKFGAILKGLLHCACCKCHMSPTHSTREGKKRYRYYVCTSAQKRGWHSCPSKSVPAGELERFVVDQIKGIRDDPALITETARQAHGQTAAQRDALKREERQLDREMAACHKELQQLAGESHNGNAGLAVKRLADLQERIVTTERWLTEVRNELERLRREMVDEADVTRALTGFEPVWEALTLREQGRLMQLLIERIDYDGREGIISITFHAGGIKAFAERGSNGEIA